MSRIVSVPVKLSVELFREEVFDELEFIEVEDVSWCKL